MEYKSGDFCKSVGCIFNKKRELGDKKFCEMKCRAYQFHKWLDDNNYKITKEQT